jgi:hypothetical protein
METANDEILDSEFRLRNAQKKMMTLPAQPDPESEARITNDIEQFNEWISRGHSQIEYLNDVMKAFEAVRLFLLLGPNAQLHCHCSEEQALLLHAFLEVRIEWFDEEIKDFRAEIDCGMNRIKAFQSQLEALSSDTSLTAQKTEGYILHDITKSYENVSTGLASLHEKKSQIKAFGAVEDYLYKHANHYGWVVD